MSEQYFMDKIKRRCGQIREHCKQINKYASGNSCKESVNDRMYIHAVSWHISRMGDIILKLNANFIMANSHLHLRKVIKLRNKIKRDFSDIHKQSICHFARHEVPVILSGLDNLVLDYALIADTANNVLTLEEIRSLCAPLFARHGVSKAILYGSYSKGEATDHSDVDLLVESEIKDFDPWDLGEELESALEKHVDIFDAKRLREDSPIRLTAMKEGLVLYQVHERDAKPDRGANGRY